MSDSSKTTFVLHGGGTSTQNENNKQFFGYAGKLKGEVVNVLFIYFHRGEELGSILNLQNKNQNQFQEYNLGKNFQFAVASEEDDKFRRLIEWADVIFAPGGKTFPIIDAYRRIKDFEKLIKGKLYMGSSGGGYAVCQYFFENSYPGVYAGMGYVPYKMIAHVNSNYENADQNTWKERIDKLNNYREQLPLLALEETEFKVIEI